MKELHKNIRSLRRLKGWKQETMAGLLNISPNAYANIEQGKTDIQLSRLEKIAEVLEVEVPELFNWDKRVVFKLSIHDSLYSKNSKHTNNHLTNTSNISLQSIEHELEKAHLVIEQQAKEIAYLKEIIELLRKSNPND